MLIRIYSCAFETISLCNIFLVIQIVKSVKPSVGKPISITSTEDSDNRKNLPLKNIYFGSPHVKVGPINETQDQKRITITIIRYV